MSADLVPLDNMAAVEALDPEAREVAVTSMLAQARSWLAHAVEATEPRAIADFKAQMAAVAEVTKQLNLSKEIQLDAAEMVRRAERGVGVAIRKGQAEGTIRARGSREFQGNQHVGGELRDSQNTSTASPYDFASHADLHGDGRTGGNGMYALAQGDDDAFEDALAEAKSEGNLSRANVVRKVRGQTRPTTRYDRAKLIRELAEQGYSSRQMPAKVGVTEETIREIARDHEIEIPADKVIVKTRRHDSTRIVGKVVEELASLHLSLDLIDYDDLAQTDAAEWATSLDESFKTLNGFRKQINRIAGR